jgi:hypothetical protein
MQSAVNHFSLAMVSSLFKLHYVMSTCTLSNYLFIELRRQLKGTVKYMIRTEETFIYLLSMDTVTNNVIKLLLEQEMFMHVAIHPNLDMELQT